MPSRTTLDLREWFGAVLRVNIREMEEKNTSVTTITIPNYLSGPLHLLHGDSVEVYIRKKELRENERKNKSNGQSSTNQSEGQAQSNGAEVKHTEESNFSHGSITDQL